MITDIAGAAVVTAAGITIGVTNGITTGKNVIYSKAMNSANPFIKMTNLPVTKITDTAVMAIRINSIPEDTAAVAEDMRKRTDMTATTGMIPADVAAAGAVAENAGAFVAFSPAVANPLADATDAAGIIGTD